MGRQSPPPLLRRMPGFRPAGSVWLRQETPACAEDTVCGIEIILLRCPLRRQGSISGLLPMHMRQLQEMDTCLRRYLRSWEFALPIRLKTPCPILSLCSHRSRIRYRSGCGVRDRMGWAGGIRSRTALGRSGQGELAKASWETASSGRTGEIPGWAIRVKSTVAAFARRR